MPKKRVKTKEDPMRRLVQGVLTLVLTTLAGWAAAKLTDLILGPVEKPDEKVAE